MGNKKTAKKGKAKAQPNKIKVKDQPKKKAPAKAQPKKVKAKASGADGAGAKKGDAKPKGGRGGKETKKTAEIPGGVRHVDKLESFLDSETGNQSGSGSDVDMDENESVEDRSASASMPKSTSKAPVRRKSSRLQGKLETSCAERLDRYTPPPLSGKLKTPQPQSQKKKEVTSSSTSTKTPKAAPTRKSKKVDEDNPPSTLPAKANPPQKQPPKKATRKRKQIDEESGDIPVTTLSEALKAPPSRKRKEAKKDTPSSTRSKAKVKKSTPPPPTQNKGSKKISTLASVASSSSLSQLSGAAFIDMGMVKEEPASEDEDQAVGMGTFNTIDLSKVKQEMISSYDEYGNDDSYDMDEEGDMDLFSFPYNQFKEEPAFDSENEVAQPRKSGRSQAPPISIKEEVESPPSSPPRALKPRGKKSATAKSVPVPPPPPKRRTTRSKGNAAAAPRPASHPPPKSINVSKKAMKTQAQTAGDASTSAPGDMQLVLYTKPSRPPTSSSNVLEKYMHLPHEEQIENLARDLDNQTRLFKTASEGNLLAQSTMATLMNEICTLRRNVGASEEIAVKEKKRAESAWKLVERTKLYSKAIEMGAEQRHFRDKKVSEVIEKNEEECEKKLNAVEKDRLNLIKEIDMLKRNNRNAVRNYRNFKQGTVKVLQGIVASLVSVLGNFFVNELKFEVVKNILGDAIAEVCQAEAAEEGRKVFNDCFSQEKWKHEEALVNLIHGGFTVKVANAKQNDQQMDEPSSSSSPQKRKLDEDEDDDQDKDDTPATATDEVIIPGQVQDTTVQDQIEEQEVGDDEDEEGFVEVPVRQYEFLNENEKVLATFVVAQGESLIYDNLIGERETIVGGEGALLPLGIVAVNKEEEEKELDGVAVAITTDEGKESADADTSADPIDAQEDGDEEIEDVSVNSQTQDEKFQALRDELADVMNSLDEFQDGVDSPAANDNQEELWDLAVTGEKELAEGKADELVLELEVHAENDDFDFTYPSVTLEKSGKKTVEELAGNKKPIEEEEKMEQETQELEMTEQNSNMRDQDQLSTPPKNKQGIINSQGQSQTQQESKESDIEYVTSWDSDRDERKTPPMIILNDLYQNGSGTSSDGGGSRSRNFRSRRARDEASGRRSRNSEPPRRGDDRSRDSGGSNRERSRDDRGNHFRRERSKGEETPVGGGGGSRDVRARTSRSREWEPPRNNKSPRGERAWGGRHHGRGDMPMMRRDREGQSQGHRY